jgi:hypothetical protein
VAETVLRRTKTLVAVAWKVTDPANRSAYYYRLAVAFFTSASTVLVRPSSLTYTTLWFGEGAYHHRLGIIGNQIEFASIVRCTVDFSGHRA